MNQICRQTPPPSKIPLLQPIQTQIIATSSSSDDDEEDDDDDEDSDSSSESCSSSSIGSSDSSSSSDSVSSDDDSDDNEQNPSANGASTAKSNPNTTATIAANTRSKDTAIDAGTSWGFAAEAKKNFDIFRRSTNALSERVFGNFDGVDKESLVKTSSNQNSRSAAAQQAAANARLLMPAFSGKGQANSKSQAGNSDGKTTGRRKTKTQSNKDHNDHHHHHHHQKDGRGTDKKTEFSSFLKTKNNRKLNAFAVCDSSDATDSKDLFTRPTKTAAAAAAAASVTTPTTSGALSSAQSFGSNRGSNSSASQSKNRLNNNVHNSKTNKKSHSDTTRAGTPMRSNAKDTSSRNGNHGNAMSSAMTTTPSTTIMPSTPTTTTNHSSSNNNNNSNSARNNNTNSNQANSNNKTQTTSGTPRRVALVSLPLDPSNKNRRYDSSSDDDIPYLKTTPSTSHQSDKHAKYSLDFASLVAGIDSHTSSTGTGVHHHHHHHHHHNNHQQHNHHHHHNHHKSQGGIGGTTANIDGIRSIPDPLGISSNYSMLSSLSPHTPPYNKNQSMGKNNQYSP